MKWPPTKEALDWVKVKNSSWKILSANSRLTVGWLLANCLPTVFIMCWAKVLANCWPTVNLAAEMWKSYVKAMKSNWTYTNHCVNTNLSRISCSMTNNFIISKLIVFIIFFNINRLFGFAVFCILMMYLVENTSRCRKRWFKFDNFCENLFLLKCACWLVD